MLKTKIYTTCWKTNFKNKLHASGDFWEISPPNAFRGEGAASQHHWKDGGWVRGLEPWVMYAPTNPVFPLWYCGQ